MAKKPVDKMTKAELLKAYVKLQKQYDKLQGQLVPAPQRNETDGWVPPWQSALTNSFEGTR